MKDVLGLGGFLVFWIVLNRWLLPYFGIQTCMSGACSQTPQVQQFKPADTIKTEHRAIE